MDWYERKSGLLTLKDFGSDLGRSWDAADVIAEAERITATARTISRPYTPTRLPDPAIPWSPFIEYIWRPSLFNSYSVIAHTGAVAGTTGAITTTGADLIILVACYDSGATVSDSKSCTWTGLTASSAGGVSFCRIYYCQAPTVGAGHTFSLSIAYGALFVIALSGSVASPFDVENGSSVTGTSLQAGSVTPGFDNEIVIAGLTLGGNSNTPLIDSSFTILDSLAASTGVHYGGALGYIIQTTAGAVNPTYSWTGSSACSARNATFKIPVAGAASSLLESVDRGAFRGVMRGGR